MILTNETVQENTQTKYKLKSKQHKTQQNKTTVVQSPLMTLDQDTRCAYSTMLPSSQGD